MKKIAGVLFIVPVLLLSSFVKVSNLNTGKELCATLKEVTAIFHNKEFDKLKGKAIGDASDPNDRQYVSLISFDNYISQVVYETDKEISFEAVLNKDFDSAEALQKELELFANQLHDCLGLEFEYSESKSFLHYTFVFDSGVEVEISGNYYSEKRRHLGIEVSCKK